MTLDNKIENVNASDMDSPDAVKRPILRLFIKWILPAAIILAAVGFAKHQIDTKPKAQRQKPPLQARLVMVEPAQQANHLTTLSAMGQVVPSKLVTLSPEVPGRIVFVDPSVIPGGVVQKGQILARIDQRDYETIVKQRQSEVAKARLNLKMEFGNQRVAQQEYKMLEEIVEDQDQELVLRKPHLQEAQIALEAAEAALAKAQLDVQRCSIKAPFNAVIQDKLVDVGTQVGTSSSLMKLMGTDEYWVEVKIHVNLLKWIIIPENAQQEGSPVKVFNKLAWGSDTYRQGHVICLLGQLEEQGRLAQLLVTVKDPLSLKSESSHLPPVLVDSYVRVEIEGQQIKSVFPVKRDYLQDGDNIWIMNDENRLEIRSVDVVFRDKEMVYLAADALKPGERIVITDISAPVDGMLLRLDHESADQAPDASNTETQG